MSTPAEELAYKIADGTARADIESFCTCVDGGSGDVFWYDTALVVQAHQPGDREFIDDALAYIELRGDALPYRVIKHQAFPGIVRFEAVP